MFQVEHIGRDRILRLFETWQTGGPKDWCSGSMPLVARLKARRGKTAKSISESAVHEIAYDWLKRLNRWMIQ